MRNGECEHRSCVRATRARQRSCRIWKKSIPRWLSIMKNIKYGENKHNRTRSNLLTQTKSVTIQGNITVMRYRTDVIRSVLLVHIRANLGMMLARDYASCQTVRSILLLFVENIVQQHRWPAKSLDINPIDHLLDLLKHKVRAQPLGSSRVLFIRCMRPFHNSIFIDTL